MPRRWGTYAASCGIDRYPPQDVACAEAQRVCLDSLPRPLEWAVSLLRQAATDAVKYIRCRTSIEICRLSQKQACPDKPTVDARG